ncbi:DNA polymerase kappa-like, partial [Olea europaea subsp. europaea]
DRFLRNPSILEPNGTSSDNRQDGHVMNIVEKAGMHGIDKEHINNVIHEASKGSLFERKLRIVKAASPNQLDEARSACDRVLTELKEHRTFNRVIVHFDLDMFFAAVEIRDSPSLKDKPVAVGGDSMVSTSNYIARRFGVRAAMSGFIARKLCPNLIIIRPNGTKYRQASSEVVYPEFLGARDGIEHQEYYDGTLPRFWWIRASEVVDEIREAIFEKTKLTCSAGISCNTVLAKISTDISKPNGQYMVRGYPKDISSFVSRTPVEKVSGIGKVSAQLLHALDTKTCSDIFEKRHLLPLRTFTAVKETLPLLEKLDGICEELCTKYLKPYRIEGRTITIKLKRNTFVTTQRSYSLLLATSDKEVIYAASKNLLLSEVAKDAKDTPDLAYRLLGVKVSNLDDDEANSGQLTIDAMLRNQGTSRTTKSAENFHRVVESPEDDSISDKLFGTQLAPQESSSYSCPSQQKATPAAHESSPRDIQSFFRERLRSSDEGDTGLKQCPYCFKPVSIFIVLGAHECRFKISIDVNRSLVPQGSQDIYRCEQVTYPSGVSRYLSRSLIPQGSQAGNTAATKVAPPWPQTSIKLHRPRGSCRRVPVQDIYRCEQVPYPSRVSSREHDSNFIALGAHVGECRFKISIDVNRSLIPQGSQAGSMTATKVAPPRSQAKARPSARGQKLKERASTASPEPSTGQVRARDQAPEARS